MSSPTVPPAISPPTSPSRNINNIVSLPIEDKTVDRAHEQQLLRELNNRLRQVLEIEQESNNDLRKSLLELQSSVVETSNHNKRLEAKLEETLNALASEKSKEVEFKESGLPSSNGLNPMVRSTYESYVNSIDRMLQSKLECYKEVEQVAQSLAAENKELANRRDDSLKQIQVYKGELNAILHDNASREVKVERLQLYLEIVQTKRQVFQNKLHSFGEQGVDTYFEHATTAAVSNDISALESKYKNIYESQQKLETLHFESDFVVAKQSLGRIQAKINKVEAENDTISGQIADVFKGIEDDKKAQLQIEVKNQDLLAERGERLKEFQAGVIMKTAVEQENDELEMKIQDVNAHCTRLSELWRTLELEHSELQATKMKHREDLINKISSAKAELARDQLRLADTDVQLDPEITKYKGLVEVADIFFSPKRPNKKARLNSSG